MSKFIITTRNFPPDYGGIQSTIYDIAYSLNLHGDIIVFADSAKGDKDFDSKQDFTITRSRGIRPIRKYLKSISIRRHLNASPDVKMIVADHWKSLDTIPENSGACVVCLIHGKEINHKKGTRLYSKMIDSLSKAKWVISNSAFTTQLAIEKGIPSSKIKTINPGVVFDNFVDPESKATAEQIFGGAKFKFISVTRLVRRKAMDQVVIALKKLKEDGVDFLYVIAGEGEEKEVISQLVQENGLEENVRILGKVDTKLKKALLSESDVFLMPSVKDKKSIEGFGIAFIEASMFGNACIGGVVGGASDAIKDGKTGVLCDGSDIDSIYKAVKLVTESTKLKSMKKEAKKFAQSFSWETQIKKYLALID